VSRGEGRVNGSPTMPSDDQSSHDHSSSLVTVTERKSILCTDAEFNAILVALPKLTEAQKAKLRPRLVINGLVNGETKVMDDEDPDGDWLLHGMLSALQKRGLVTSTRLKKGVAARLAPGYEEKARQVRKLFTQGARRKLNYAEKILLTEIATEAMISRWRTDINLAKVLRCTHLLPSKLDRAFPDYLRAKMVDIILAGVNTNGKGRNTHRRSSGVGSSYADI
jgi:hypothetical protein